MITADSKLRALVVDDDESMAKLLGTTLSREFASELELTTTIDPTMVWGLAAEGKVDLCISDMDMPSINGFKLLKQLKQLNPLTQVIFLTAQPTVEAARSAFALGVDEFLPKPVNLRELCKAVAYLSARIRRFQLDLIAHSV